MFRIKFPTKKSVGADVYHPPMVELGDWEDWYGWNIMNKNSKLYSLQGWMLQKIPILWRKGSSKSFLELNSLQKSHWTHISISPQSGARWLDRLIWLKYYNVQKRQIIFTSEMNVVKNTDFMKKALSQSCLKLNFQQKSHWLHMSISSWSRARWLKRLTCSKYYNVGKRGK